MRRKNTSSRSDSPEQSAGMDAPLRYSTGTYEAAPTPLDVEPVYVDVLEALALLGAGTRRAPRTR